MTLVKGIHHVSMTCCNKEEFERCVFFYKEIIGLPAAKTWAAGIMFDTGNGIIEIFNNGESDLQKGTIRHFAFATDDVDACAKAVSEAGYEVFIEPKDIEIPAKKPYPARIAFCKGPLGEEIEFFQER